MTSGTSGTSGPEAPEVSLEGSGPRNVWFQVTQALKAGLKALKSVAHTEAGKNWGMLFRADSLRENVENPKILEAPEGRP